MDEANDEFLIISNPCRDVIPLPISNATNRVATATLETRRYKLYYITPPADCRRYSVVSTNRHVSLSNLVYSVLNRWRCS